MKKLTFLILCISLSIWAGCGSDDNGGEPPTGPSGPPRVVTLLSPTAPSMTDPDDPLWATAPATTVSIASGSFSSPSNLREREELALAVASEVTVRAIYHQGTDSLYVKVTWADGDHDVWLQRWRVDSLPSGVPAFSRDSSEVTNEDGLLAFFADPGGSYWDVWYWRALTTGTEFHGGTIVTGLAEGNRFFTDQLMVDTAQSSGLNIAFDNGSKGGFSIPSYMHKDTSEFTGYMLYLDDDLATPTQLPTGWTVGQFIPGRRIDTTVSSPTKAAARGSKWDVWSVSEWSTGGPWSVVLHRALNTGFSDDLDMSTLDSVKMRIGIADNHLFRFDVGSSNQGFTGDFWLIL